MIDRAMSPRAVVARESELDRLRGFLAGTKSQSLVLRGEPGIGKTLLWQIAVDDATAQGVKALAHRAAEAEAALAFTALADLVGPVLDQVDWRCPRRDDGRCGSPCFWTSRDQSRPPLRRSGSRFWTS